MTAKEKTALFIGHGECFGIGKATVTAEIVRHIEKGVDCFLSGGQGDFDKLSARCVFDLKKDYPQIENILVIPYLTFNIFDKDIFDGIIYPDGFEKYYFKAAIQARNRYMVDNSMYAICYVNHDFGGAAKTYQRAVKRGLFVTNLGAL